MRRLRDRTRLAAVGAISIVLASGLASAGVSIANGAIDATYRLVATFDTAGQGLIVGSDVKVHGVDIGRVGGVELVGGRARVTMTIDAEERVPRAASATVRPKTLFGEKFVDIAPGPHEVDGPFLHDGDVISETHGGFELERVLAEAYPILAAIDPDELATVLSELAEGGRGLGPTVNRSLANGAAVLDVQARHNDDTARFLADLAALSDELADHADELVVGAEHLNQALPTINSREDELAVLLDEAARLSGDAADLLEANRPLLEKAVTEGGKTLQVLFDQRDDIPGFVLGLRWFFEVLGSIGRIELGDGTRLAAVKGVLGGGPACGRTTRGCPEYTGPPAGASAAGASPSAAPPTLDPRLPTLPEPVSGAEAIRTLVEDLLP